MAFQTNIAGHVYVFDVDYGEESEVARVIVRSAEGGPEGLWLVDRDGGLEAAEDVSGFGPNPAVQDGLWPVPPEECICDAQRIAEQKHQRESGDGSGEEGL